MQDATVVANILRFLTMVQNGEILSLLLGFCFWIICLPARAVPFGLNEMIEKKTVAPFSGHSAPAWQEPRAAGTSRV